MEQSYFSDREVGAKPRTEEDIPGHVWGGLIVLIRSRLTDGSFGFRFPEECPDGGAIVGCDSTNFSLALKAEVSGVLWPLNPEELPPHLAILDLLEFCYRAVGKPTAYGWHSFFRHDHLNYDEEAGRTFFRDDVNRLFARNGIAYELREDGQIKRIDSSPQAELLRAVLFQTGDADLNALLEIARSKFFDPNDRVRRESLEKLWDAWERLKTLEDADKRRGMGLLLDKAAGGNVRFRTELESEALALTKTGNDFAIRHSETTKVPIESKEQVDYLFHRLFSLIHLLLRMTGRVAQ